MKKASIRSLIAIGIALAVCCMCFAGPQPAAAQKTIKWKMASVWPAGLRVLYSLDQHFVEVVNKLANGQLEITLYAGGELCAGPEVLDMVRSGTIQAGGDAGLFWAGKNTAFDLLATGCASLTAEDFLCWIYEGGGLQYYQEVYGLYNCVYFPHSQSRMESGIRTNKPIRTLSDLKGMRIRMAGLVSPKILEHFGGRPVMINPGELYEALRRGIIDGLEFSAPVNDRDFHIEDVTKYWLTPGWHQTSAVYGVLINKDAWNALPAHLKYVVEQAAMASMSWGYSMFTVQDALATRYFIEDKGITTTKLSDEELDQIEQYRNTIYEELAAKNPLYEKILKSQMDYMKMMSLYRDAAKPWSFGRNPTSYPSTQ